MHDGDHDGKSIFERKQKLKNRLSHIGAGGLLLSHCHYSRLKVIELRSETTTATARTIVKFVMGDAIEGKLFDLLVSLSVFSC
ncbi:hypothetical protein CBW65_22360 [Tumebacillus avium]|uniref:Uncharacterized protein n=1 Tax=Tumebacillus avium TaxID=1903704 RepID=A0A1Y0IT17_9BACL|nr:hypothetical protein CBW65_22360 [Tumebacillus avium]